MKRLLLFLLTLIMLLSFCATAWGDSLFDAPLEISIKGIHADHVDPLDEQRLGDLNQLLRHIGVVLRTGEVDGTAWSGIIVKVDDQTVDELWLGESEDEVLIRVPGADTFYSADSLSALDVLISAEPFRVSEMILPDIFLSDAEAMTDAVFTERDGIEVTKESQTVRDTNEATYGRVVSRYRIKDITTLSKSISDQCPDGALSRFLSGFSVTEIKDCYALCKKDGKAAKVVFSGSVEDRMGHTYQISLEWKLRRGEKNAADRDHMTITYKGEAGTGSLEFRLTRKSADEVTYDIYNWEQDGFTLSKGKKDTIHVKRGEENLITGEISLHLSGNAITTLDLQFDLQIGDGLSGNIEWKTTGDQDFSGIAVIQSIETGQIGQPAALKAVPLPTDNAELTTIAQNCSDQFAARLIAHLVLLDAQEDNMYLRRDLSEEAWSEIVTSARELLEQIGGEEE